MSAMSESLSLLQKWTPTSSKIRDLEDRLKLIGRFIETMNNSDTMTSVRDAYSLLSSPGLEVKN